MQTFKQVLYPMLGTLVALAILAGSYYVAKSSIPPVPPVVPVTPITVLGGPATEDPLGAFLTPTGVDRGPDGRYITQDARQIIPDNNLRRGAISRITVPDHINIQSLKVVNIHVTHSDTSELVVQLLSPDLTLHTLVDGLCPGHANWLALTLDDQSDKPLGSECIDNLNDAYAPPEPNKLSIFNGGDAQGQWVLSVKDKKAGNVGYLEGWSLLFNTSFGKNGTPGAATPLPARSPVPGSPTGTSGGATLSPTPAAATSTAAPALATPTDVLSLPPSETPAPAGASPTPAVSGQGGLSSTNAPPVDAADPPPVYYP
jgi:subtilisin-like proprotein convertase family protein